MIIKSNTKSADESKKTIELARERFDLALEAEADLRALALEDLNFRAGDQWDEQLKRERSLDNRPSLVINRIPQFIRQVTNDQRQNRPSIKVFPVDDQGDVDTAKVIQGMIRHIEYRSNADVAYDTAFDGAATKGFGYFRIITDYVDPRSFEQEILIKRIRNAFSVYLDPNAKEPDGSDASWAFVFEDMNKDEYEAEYKDSELASMREWTSVGDTSGGWVQESTVRIAEYFYKEFKEVTLCQLNDGTVIEKSEAKSLPEGFQIVAERSSKIPVVKWCKINGVEVLEETEWLGQWIPIIPVYGDELDIDGKRVLEGIVRHAKDSQRMYNYWASSETETIALAPRAPWIGAEGQFEGNESAWQSANRKNHAFLQYKPKTINGQLAPPPQRNVFEPPVQAITQARMQASDDLKATTGIYDSALGARSNETSGVAIQRRNIQAQTSNFHFIDNLTRSLRHAGRIIVDLIPKVYDTARAARIVGESGEQEIVKINELFQHKGESKVYDLGTGKYDVTIETGPSFATKRQEAVASMLDLTRSYPQMAQVCGDLLVKNMDWPGATEIAERLKKTLPPGIADDPKEQKQIPPEIQQKMQQMDQMIQKLSAALNEAHDKLDTKKIELESKERIEMKKIQAAVEMKMADLGSRESVELLAHEISMIQNRLNLLSINEPIEIENEQENEGSGGESAEMPEISQPNPSPTGGPSPGQPMGV